MVRRRIYLALLLTTLVAAAPLGQTGFLEGNINYSLDTLSTTGSKLTHQERVSWGIQGHSTTLLKMNYKVTIGGVLKGNTAFAKTQISPEYGIQTSLQPYKSLDLALFSYSRLRNPMQIMSDSLEYKEFVHGVKLSASLKSGTRLSVASGIRSQEITHRDSIETSQQFIQMHLDQRIGNMRFRLAGESDVWSRDTLDQRQQTMVSAGWHGNLGKKLRWTASNAYFLTDDYTFWRLSHRLKYDLTQRQAVWARYTQGDFAYGAQTLQRNNYDLRYRYQWRPAIGVDLAFKGNRVSVPDSIDIFHWRSYGLSTHWLGGSKRSFRGNLDAGFKESFRYGKGVDVLLRTSESWQVMNSKIVTLHMRDDISAEFFQRMDETGDPRYDISHKIRLTTAFLPGRSYQIGNHFKVHSHIGSDLDFSSDTLRNAIIDEVYFKAFRQKSQVAVFYRTVLDIRDSENDLQFSLNTRFFHRVTRYFTYNFMSMYRFQSDVYPDYLWLTAILKVDSNHFNYALELQTAGPPSMAFEQDLSIRLRFVRRL